MKRTKLKTNKDRVITDLYCGRCGKSLILEYKFQHFDTHNGKKVFYLQGTCPNAEKGILGAIIREFSSAYPEHTKNRWLDTRFEDELEETVMYIS